MTISLINCTPHPINIYDEEGKTLVETIATSGHLARLEEEPQQQTGTITTPSGANIKVCTPQQFKDLKGLPEQRESDIVVSMLVAKKLLETGEWQGAIYGPDTGTGAVRENGRIMGCRWLIKYQDRKV